MRIGYRLLIGYLLIVILSGYFILTIFIKEVKPGVRRATEGMLIDTANLLAHVVTQDLNQLTDLQHGDFVRAFKAVNRFPIAANIDGIIKNHMAYRIYIADKNGIVIFDSSGKDVGKDYSRWNDVYLTLRGRYGARSSLSNPDDPTSSVMYVAAPLRINDEIVGSLTVAKPNKAMEVIVQRGERRIFYFGSILILSALLIGLIFIFWINRSINKLISYAKKVSQFKDVPLPKIDSPELRTLANALEEMRIKLNGKDYVEQYVHTLTHELKSPLAAIRGATEILQDNITTDTEKLFLHNIDEQSQRILLLIDKMLQQARLESRVGIDIRAVEIDQLIVQVVNSYNVQAKVKNITLVLEQNDRTTLFVDQFLLRQAMSNLLDNAFDFTPAKGIITVTAIADKLKYTLIVTDTGCGIPDYAKEKIYTRFYSLPRLNKSKSTGLGLAFVKEVALLHHGEITLMNNPQGDGVSAVLTLSYNNRET